MSAEGGVVLGHAFLALEYAGLDLDRGVQAVCSASQRWLSRATSSSGVTVCTIDGALGMGSLRVVDSMKQPESSRSGRKSGCGGQRGEGLFSSATCLLHGVPVAGHVARRAPRWCWKTATAPGDWLRRPQSRDSPSSPAPWPRAATARRDWPPDPAAGRRADRCCKGCCSFRSLW